MLGHSRRQYGRERAERAALRRVLVNFADVLTHRLLGAEEFAALGARYVAHVAVHAHVVAVATLLVGRKVALTACHDGRLLVQEDLVTTEEMRCAWKQKLAVKYTQILKTD